MLLGLFAGCNLGVGGSPAARVRRSIDSERSESGCIQPKASQPQISIRLSRAELSVSGHARQAYYGVRMLSLCSLSTHGTSHAPLSRMIRLFSQKAELM